MDPAITSRTRSLYETVADSYASLVADVGFEPSIDHALLLDFAEQLTEQDRAPRVLDAGCGTGRLIGHLRSLNERVVATGVDLSPAMLAHAQRSHPDVMFVEADLMALPLPDESFHGVLAWYSIIHTPPAALPDLFHELRRVLRPGGLLLLGFQAGTGERVRAGAYGHDVELHAFLHTTTSVRTALRAAGLTTDTTLDRGPRRNERLRQGFVLARAEPARTP